MSASINDKFASTFNAANPNVARVTGVRVSLATTLTCDNLAGWPVSTAVHFSTYQLDTNSAVIAGTQIDWKGIVTSSTTIGTLTRKAGASDSGNAIGDVVEMLPTGSWGKDLTDGILVQHNQDGTHAAVTATSLTVSGTSSFTGAVTLPSNTVTTAKISNAQVTPDKLATGAAQALVATSETHASASYGVLTTTTDQVTVTVGANGLALVGISAKILGSNQNAEYYVGIAVSGATTIAAADDRSIMVQCYANSSFDRKGAVFLYTGLTPGSTTFKMNYRESFGTGTYSDRRIGVVPL